MDSYSASRLHQRKRRDPMPMVLALLMLAAVPVLGYVAWKQLAQPDPSGTVAPATPTPAALAGAQATATAPTAPSPGADSTDDNTMAAADSGFLSSNSTSGGGARAPTTPRTSSSSLPPSTASSAIARVGDAIEQAMSLGDGKCLVIWLIDRSKSCEQYHSDAFREINSITQSLAGGAGGTGEDALDAAPLLTVVGTIGQEANILTAEPVASATEVSTALAEIRVDEGGAESTFAAVGMALDRFLTWRTQKRRPVIIAVLTDEVGDDVARSDDVVARLVRYSIPVHVVGVSALFGQDGGDEAEGKRGDGSTLVRQGPDAHDIDWVRIDYPDGSDSVPQVPTGLGPYALERLCRESGGQFYAVFKATPASGLSNFVSGGGGTMGGRQGDNGGASNYWAAAGSSTGGGVPGLPMTGMPSGGPFDSNFTRRYPPVYLSEAEYQASVQANRAKSALIQAARLGRVAVLGGSQSSFSGTMTDAERATVVSQVQRPAAQVVPMLQRVYDTLKAGEPDLAKLTSPADLRWKVAFELAYARSMAALVRADGYRSMVATLAGSKPFENEGSTMWMLVQTDGLPAVSTLDRMAKTSRTMLETIIKDHPGTPWAEAAQRELSVPIGWVFEER